MSAVSVIDEPLTGYLGGAGSISGLALPEVRPLSVEEFTLLADAGCFRGEKVELIYGRIVRHMSPMGIPHYNALRLCSDYLHDHLATVGVLATARL